MSDTNDQLMNEEEFWEIIDKSKLASGNNYQDQTDALKGILLSLDPSQIEKFNNRFTALMAASYHWKLWGAAYVINGGCSDDCFDYFRHYLIGQGKERFYQTLQDPESCVNWVKPEDEDSWEGLQYAAFDAYKQRTGRSLPNTYEVEYELKGEPFDEDTVQQQYPQLAEKFMGEY